MGAGSMNDRSMRYRITPNDWPSGLTVPSGCKVVDKNSDGFFPSTWSISFAALILLSPMPEPVVLVSLA